MEVLKAVIILFYSSGLYVVFIELLQCKKLDHMPYGNKKSTSFIHLGTYAIIKINRLPKQRNRKPRTLKDDLRFEFKAFGKNFSMPMKHQKQVTSASRRMKLNIVSNNTTKRSVYRQDNYFVGHSVKNKTISSIYGFMEQDEFIGMVNVDNDTFAIEPAYWYDPSKQGFSVMYKAKNRGNVTLNLEQNLTSSCGTTTMNTSQHDHDRHKRFLHKMKNNCPNKIPKYCELHVIVDCEYYSVYRKVNQVISQVIVSIEKVNNIFLPVDYNQDGCADRIGFMIVEFTVFTRCYTNGFNSQIKYDAAEYLDEIVYFRMPPQVSLVSETCLALFMTYKDFDDDIVGLAILGNTNPRDLHGICSKIGKNIVMINGRLDGSKLDHFVMFTTIAHEFGHAFGSEHDDFTSCRADDIFGPFLMYSYVDRSTEKPNVERFSNCSLAYMNPIVSDRMNRDCFKEYSIPVCGNAIIEEGEECDCGGALQCDLKKSCCVPSGFKNECKYKGYNDGKLCFCEPDIYPCCEENKTITSASTQRICKLKTECTAASVCDGKSYRCPKARRLDGQRCMEDNRICHNGACSRSICTTLGPSFEVCQCTDKEKLCVLCCGKKNNTGSCKPYGQYVDSGAVIMRKAGSLCGSYKGYCDEYHKCVNLPPDDLQSILNHAMKNDSKIYLFFKNEWYYVLLGGFVIGILALLVAKYTPKRIGNIPSEHVGEMIAEADHVLSQTRSQLATLSILSEQLKKMIDMKYGLGRKTDVSRVIKYFSSAPPDEIKAIAEKHSVEVEAVQDLIDYGYPMNQFFKSYPLENQSKTNHIHVT